MGTRRPDRVRRAGRLHRRDRDDRADRSGRHALAGRRPGEDEGPGQRRLRLRAGALHPRRARDPAGRRHDRHAQRDRRDRVRDAADPRLRADRARRLVQADRPGRHADRPGGRQRQGRRLPDAHQLDPGPPGRAPHLRRLPQPASRRRHQLRRRRQHASPAGIKTALATAHQSGETMASTRTRLDPNALKLVGDMVFTDFWADTTKPGVTARPTIALKYTGNAVASRRPRHAGAGQRPHQLPDPHRAAVDAQPRRQHLHRLPQRPRQARPERDDRRAPAGPSRTRS